jgi:alkaline phosphatase D
VVLEATVNTLKPAESVKSAPMAIVQGPFSARLDRSAFNGRWSHVAATFDSSALRVYLDGKLVATHKLPIPGPCSEFSGLVFGGDRTGTGQNFAGRLDEIAVWSRALSDAEIRDLDHGGAPQALPTERTPAK